MGVRVVVLTALVLALLGTGTAQATTVRMDTFDRVHIQADGNDTFSDQLTVSFRDAGAGVHEITVTDAFRILTTADGCVQGTTARQAVCLHPDNVLDPGNAHFFEVVGNLRGGNDRITAAGVTAVPLDVEGDDGNDTIIGSDATALTVASGVGTVDSLDGGEGNDRITTGAGDDLAGGGGGDDVLLQSADGAQRLNGGTGHDVVDYSAYTVPVTLAIGAGPFSGAADPADAGIGATPPRPKDDIQSDVEELRTGSAEDTLVGDADDERFDGGFGADTIDGEGGSDTVTYERRTVVGVRATLGGSAARRRQRGHDPGRREPHRRRRLRSPHRRRRAEPPGRRPAERHSRGGGEADELLGGTGADDLFGDAGDDVLEGGFGADDHDRRRRLRRGDLPRPQRPRRGHRWRRRGQRQPRRRRGRQPRHDRFRRSSASSGSSDDDLLVGNLFPERALRRRRRRPDPGRRLPGRARAAAPAPTSSRAAPGPTSSPTPSASPRARSP